MPDDLAVHVHPAVGQRSEFTLGRGVFKDRVSAGVHRQGVFRTFRLDCRAFRLHEVPVLRREHDAVPDEFAVHVHPAIGQRSEFTLGCCVFKDHVSAGVHRQ